MDQKQLRELLGSVAAGAIQPETAAEMLRDLPFAELGYATIDHHRALRKGFPEVIFCQGKSIDQVIGIVEHQKAAGETVLGTRASPEMIEALIARFSGIESNRAARCFRLKSTGWKAAEACRGLILVVCAGTSDLPVVEECRYTIETMGHPCSTIVDVGVAGIHRLLAKRDDLLGASVIVVVAGMEGALLSAVGGLVDCPVIGVPTSVGYGSHLNGLVPLFAMLNSCASGTTVVNIDNGFGAGYAAVLMNTGR